jgi:hypothetical protein
MVSPDLDLVDAERQLRAGCDCGEEAAKPPDPEGADEVERA